MIRRPPRSTRTDTLFPYTTLFRSQGSGRDRALPSHRPREIASALLQGLGARSRPWDRASRSRSLAQHLDDEHCRYIQPIPGRARPVRIDDHHVGSRRSEEHTSELQSLMRNSYAVFCLKKKTKTISNTRNKRTSTLI